jgi:hypothetical protein
MAVRDREGALLARDGEDYRLLAGVTGVILASAAYACAAGLSLAPAHAVATTAPAAASADARSSIANEAPPPHLFWLSQTLRYGDARLVDIAAVGDIMLGSPDTGLDPALQPDADMQSLVGPQIGQVFAHATLAFGNLEGALYDGDGRPEKDCGHCYVFHSPEFYAGLLARLGIRVVSLANNHSGDYGEEGRAATMRALRASGIAYCGLDREGARIAELALDDGRRAAVIAFAPNSGTLDINDPEAEARLIRTLKSGHDLVIVSFHGGGEGEAHAHVTDGHDYFDGEDRGDVRAFAHRAIESGADLVIGQGPHIPRALEIYRGRLIAYSLGNFWTHGAIGTHGVRGAGPLLEAWLAPDGTLAGFAIHSTQQHGGAIPQPDPDELAQTDMLALTRSDFPETAALLDRAGGRPDGVSAVRTSAQPAATD